MVELAQNQKHDEALAFFAEEYKLNHMIATLKTPFVAILNGITSMLTTSVETCVMEKEMHRY